MAGDHNLEKIEFVHLRSHSAYSLQEGAIGVDKLISLAIADCQPAIAITDSANMFCALEFSEKAAQKGLQPLIGCHFEVDFGVSTHLSNKAIQSIRQMPYLVFICQNETGYQNLIGLISRAYMNSAESAHLCLDFEDLKKRSDGLICLSGGPRGPLNELIADNRKSEARDILTQLHAVFDDRFYIEMQRFENYDLDTEHQLMQLAVDYQIPVVATNEIFFETREDYDAHDALLCIKDGRFIVEDDRRRETRDHYFKTQKEMVALFADLPEAIANTVEIAQRCHFRPRTRDPILPYFSEVKAGASTKEAVASEASELALQARAGLEERLNTHGMAPNLKREDYIERLNYELSVIENMGFPGYFLIVADFIKWAKNQNIPVGPGRGSGAGSVVAWSLTITDLDPMRFSLLFERFLNPERVSMPDFDIDFCQDRREEVIAYVQDKYGFDQVAQIITFGSMQARVALRDVGRVMQLPYGQVDRLAKLIPNNPANMKTIKEALEDEPRLREARKEEESVDSLLSTAMKLEGLLRHASTHAAGIVIGDRPLHELVPLYRDPRSSMPVTQFNMKWVEPAGLVKFDFLGLKTLTVMDRAVKLIETRGENIDLNSLPLDDAQTYEMLARGETVGVFQLESAGMRKALIGMKPDCFEDIIALVALYRPGPMENIPVYNARKHGEEEADYIHPKIEHVLKETQGVIIYQEQVMQIAQILSGYSLGEADMLRRAMGKKIRSEMDKQRARFVDGAVERGLDKARANIIFDLLAKFADYGFNKSHAAAYALVAYQTAYLKAHYPAEFLAASMTLDMGNTDKLSEFRREALRLNIDVVLPSVNSSGKFFDVRNGKIYYALAALKGVGEGAIEHLHNVRGKEGFESLQDFFRCIDPKQLKKNALEALVNAGAFDCLYPDRAQIFASLERFLANSQRQQRDLEVGQNDMFGDDVAAQPVEFVKSEPWDSAQTLQRELSSAGFYLSAHPLDEYADYLEQMRVQDWATFSENVKNGVSAGRLAGTIVSFKERNTRSGNRMGVVQLSDSTGQFEAVLFSDGLAKFRNLLEPGNCVIMICAADERPEGISVRLTDVKLIDEEVNSVSRTMRLFIRNTNPISALTTHLSAKGKDEVSIVVIENNGSAEIEVKLQGGFSVSQQLANAMKAVDGIIDVEIV